MTDSTTDKLAELIAKRRQCLVQLRDAGLRQAELITAGNMGALLRLLSAKNQWIVALQSIERDLKPFHEEDPDTRDWASPTEREKCAAQATECKRLLDELMELERDNEQQMAERRDRVAGQLQAAQAAGEARTAYQAHQSTPQTGHQGLASLETNSLDHLDVRSNG